MLSGLLCRIYSCEVATRELELRRHRRRCARVFGTQGNCFRDGYTADIADEMLFRSQ